MRVRLIALFAAMLALLCVGVFVASPYLAVRGLRASVVAGDGEGVRSYLDVESLRESLRLQIEAALTRKLGDSPMPSATAKAASTLATLAAGAAMKPDALSRSLRWSSEDAGTGETRWVDLSTFEVIVPSTDPTQPVVVRWHRQGLTWKVTELIVPDPSSLGRSAR